MVWLNFKTHHDGRIPVIPLKYAIMMEVSLKRSTINSQIRIAVAVAAHYGVSLPPWAEWSPSQWENVASDPAYDEIRDCMLGWDVTDFGSGDFHKIGRVLFTLRNGRYEDSRYPKTYAEKLLVDPENQRAPAHFHLSKREDIVAVAGGRILVQLEKADALGKRSGEPMHVQVDGIRCCLEAGEIIRLEPGMSLTIPPLTIHQFWAEEGAGWSYKGNRWSLSREVSSICNDKVDNFFIDAPGVRFPEIEEDEDRAFYLCHEYPRGSQTFEQNPVTRSTVIPCVP